MSAQWNQQVSGYVFSNVIQWMFGIIHSKTNRLQKTIEYKTNEQSKKYLNWSMHVEIKLGKASACSFCFYST